MPRQQIRSLYSIFVSSPWNMLAERDQVSSVIDELNRLWGKFLGFHVELVQDATDTYSGIGLDGQDVVNKQIGFEYNLYLGIMGNRFGTPTPRAGSGTEEEFNFALSRYKKDPSSVRLMFLFRKLSAAELEASDQALRVKAFTSRIRQEGMYTQDFNDLLDLGHLARRGITRYTQEWLMSNNLITDKLLSAAREAAHETVGNADHQNARVSEILGEMTSAVAMLGSAISDFNAAIEHAAEWNQYEEACERGAHSLNTFATRIRNSAPYLSAAFEKIVTDGYKLLTILVIPSVEARAATRILLVRLDASHARVLRATESLMNLSGRLRDHPARAGTFARGLGDAIDAIEIMLSVIQQYAHRLADLRAEIALIGNP